ncbi:SH3 domain-containing protein [Mesorhizobium sp. CAU 1741]|uniref:SH3 domain-containing protein n=1 Tax=Mesorhizobium sp. CAU 1741 TaxID=3140366 RepID=UPI00325B52FE
MYGADSMQPYQRLRAGGAQQRQTTAAEQPEEVKRDGTSATQGGGSRRTLLLATPILAQPINEVRIEFAAGASGTSVDGSLTGERIVDYVLGARAGQTMSIDLKSSNPAGYFNLMRGNDPQAIHIGSVSGNSYTDVLPADADYRIRVYLMRSAARRNESMDYELSVSIDGAASDAGAAPGPDYADGLAGGPDFWRVAGLPRNDTLNVRSGPGTSHGIVGELADGDVVANRGCEMASGSKWCRIEAGSEQRFRGWVSGRYLVEAARPQNGGTTAESSGKVPCSPSAGQPTRDCTFRASRGNGGNASVWIALPAGGERYVRFVDGRPVETDPGMDITFEQISDLYLVRIGGVERYEIPEAVVFGG